MSDKKMGRPTACPKDVTLRVRLTPAESTTLKDLAQKIGVTQSDFVRGYTPLSASKAFESCLSLQNLPLLEAFSQECIDFFYAGGSIAKSELSNRFPAFTLSEDTLCVKYPTYNIRVLTKVLQGGPVESDLKSIESAYPSSYLSQTLCTLLGGGGYEETYLPEYAIRERGLEKAAIIRDEILQRLDGLGYRAEVWPNFILIPLPYKADGSDDPVISLA